MDKSFWDDKYREQDMLWSGEPNGALVIEAAELTPGRALDMGCGEGADSLWLARQGWQVTAADISTVALRRAATLTTEATDGIANKIVWSEFDVTTAAPRAGAFDLISVFYCPIPREPEHSTLHNLISGVAPGGTLLFVSHDLTDFHWHEGPDPRDFYQPEDVAEQLDDAWEIVTYETRERPVPTNNKTPHVQDVVLRARRSP